MGDLPRGPERPIGYFPRGWTPAAASALFVPDETAWAAGDARVEFSRCDATGKRATTLLLDKANLRDDDGITSAILAEGFATTEDAEFSMSACRDCNLCAPVRVRAGAAASRRQRRAARDAALTLTVDDDWVLGPAHRALVHAYRAVRRDLDPDLAERVVDSRNGMPLLANFHDAGGTLRGFVLCVASGAALEAVVHAFDPAWSPSTGTAILSMLFAHAAAEGFAHVYVGHLDKGGLGYKLDFAGAEVLEGGGWVPARSSAVWERVRPGGLP